MGQVSILVSLVAGLASASVSPQTIVRGIRSLMATKSANQLYRQQQTQTNEALQKVATLVNFSFVLRGISSQQASGDFIDVTLLEDNRLLVRFGDVMGHDRQAAELAVALQIIFSEPTIASLLARSYQQGLTKTFALLEALVQDLDNDDYRFYTMTSTIIDLDEATLTSVFAGSGQFYLVRLTNQEVVVKELYASTASTTFVSLDTSVASAHDSSNNTVPLHNDYQPGDVLVYLSDGLLERRIGDQYLDNHPLLKQLIADCLNECNNFDEFAELLFDKIAQQTANPMPDDSSILALQLPASRQQ